MDAETALERLHDTHLPRVCYKTRMNRSSSPCVVWGCWAIALFVVSGCQTLGYYHQAAMGQWQVSTSAKPVNDLLSDPATPHELRERLQLVQAIRQFAADELGLAIKARYTRYTDLHRDFVLWNVFAAPEFSLQAKTWCYPFVGCVPYRGYFKEPAATRQAARLTAKGYETYVGGVPAYSTLGWFKDPVLNTFVDWPEPELVNLLVHELSHGQLWVNGDVAFNESFATAVAEIATRVWFAQKERMADYDAWQQRRQAWLSFRALLLQLKSRLETYYEQSEGLDDGARRLGKSQLQAAFLECVQATARFARYRSFATEELNNAYLVSLSTYRQWVPAFKMLFVEHDSWTAFFSAAAELAERGPEEREAALAALSQQYIDTAANDGDTEQVQCEALANHGFDAEAAG